MNMGQIINNENQRFTVETEIIFMRGRPVTLTSRTPIFTPEEREKRRREIEAQLYNICLKYHNKKQEKERAPGAAESKQQKQKNRKNLAN
jgi:hypothetical protein